MGFGGRPKKLTGNLLSRSIIFDEPTWNAIEARKKQSGESVSGVVRHFVTVGDGCEADRKVLQLEQAIQTLQTERDSALSKAADLEAAIEHLKNTKPSSGIDWSRYPAAQREAIQQQWLAKHPGASL